MLIPVFINGALYHFQSEISILEACRAVGINVPRFCYHENLSIAGNCRMCLVEVQEVLKPVVSCSTDIFNGIIIYTDSPLILKARENILELLLLNHPLDCPICDQAGECDLQDQAIFFGSSFGRNFLKKRSVEDKLLNHIIQTIMVRCIHCTRCVRFGEEICNIKFFGTLGRGEKTEVGNYIEQLSLSEMSANVVDLCPVGALTLKTLPFQIRPWEVQHLESIDLSDSLGANIFITYRGVDIFRVVPKKNKHINDSWISNKCRFYYDLMVKIAAPTQLYSRELGAVVAGKASLFLLNPDVNLKTLVFLKKASLTTKAFSVKLLNSTAIKTNINFWNIKAKIKDLNRDQISTFFIISSNLSTEMPLLNVKLKSSVNQGSSNVFIGCYDFSTYTRLVCFAAAEIALLLQGAHAQFSSLFFSTKALFFSTKVAYAFLDSAFFKVLKYKKIRYYAIPAFCNSEGANSLALKPFNFKELRYKQQVFCIGLDDTYFLRKITPLFSFFFWVNQFSSTLLMHFVAHWLPLRLNQEPGVYLNLEQRAQVFSLLSAAYVCNISQVFTPIFYGHKAHMKDKAALHVKFLRSFNINEGCTFGWLNEIKEQAMSPTLFETIKLFNYYNCWNMFDLSPFLFIKRFPFKFSVEDPYRAALRLKYSRTLIKSSQLLRAETQFK